MKRGEVWTVSGGAPYAGKPRPAVIVQEDRFEATTSITLCAFTTDPTDAPLLRMLVEPTVRNGLKSTSRLMIDKITTCLLYTSPSPRDRTRSRMPSSA